MKEIYKELVKGRRNRIYEWSRNSCFPFFPPLDVSVFKKHIPYILCISIHLYNQILYISLQLGTLDNLNVLCWWNLALSLH